MSNALGMVFDHGCDAINAGAFPFHIISVLEMGDPVVCMSAIPY